MTSRLDNFTDAAFAFAVSLMVIGGAGYQRPKVRLPVAGGAPEIAASCGEVFILLRQNKRSFVDKLDFTRIFVRRNHCLDETLEFGN